MDLPRPAEARRERPQQEAASSPVASNGARLDRRKLIRSLESLSCRSRSPHRRHCNTKREQHPRPASHVPSYKLRRHFANPLLILNQGQNPEFFRNMKAIGHWRSPCNRLSVIRRPLTAKQVHTKGSAGRRTMMIESSERNSHRTVPYLSLRIDPRINFKSRVPSPPHRMIRKIEIYIKVGPFTLRRNFELLVSPNVLKVSADKQFSYIPSPQPVSLQRCIRRRL